MSQVAKLLLTIEMDRIKGNIEAELDDALSVFRQGKWTESLLNLRLICERHVGGPNRYMYTYLYF